MPLCLAVPNVQHLSLESLARAEGGGICGSHCQGSKASIKCNNLEIRVTAPRRPAAHQRHGGVTSPAGPGGGQPCPCGGATFAWGCLQQIVTAVGLAWPAMALWGPESISKVVLTAQAGARGLRYLPSPRRGQALKGALRSSFPVQQMSRPGPLINY